jgi:hypothetical protein
MRSSVSADWVRVKAALIVISMVRPPSRGLPWRLDGDEETSFSKPE